MKTHFLQITVDDVGDILTFPENVTAIRANDKWHNASDEYTVMVTDR